MNFVIKRFKQLVIIIAIAVYAGGIVNLDAAYAAESAKITIPAGTFFMARTSETIDSRRHAAGHRFTMALEADIVVDGKVAAPKGTVIYGRLAESKQAGRIAGKSELTIELTHIMLNNQMFPIMTSGIKAVAEEGSGSDTTKKAARGAAIGALADGKSGAKKGAKIGLGVAVLTRGASINIPQGTLLEFTLAAPFTY